MNGRTIFALLALSLSPVVAACSSEEPAPKSSTLKLDGTYRPVSQGAIASVTFSNDKNYYLVPSGCSASDCVDIGTYRLDAATSTVILTNGETGRESTITLENVKTSEAAAVLVKTYLGGMAEFVSRGNETTTGSQQLNEGDSKVTGNQQQLNEGQQKLAEQVVELIKTIVEALMNKQDMKKDDDKKDDDKDDDKKEDKPNPLDCKQGVPTQDSTPAEKLAYAARCPNGP